MRGKELCKSLQDYQLKKEHNLRILEKPATTDKFSRAQPVSAAWNDGRVLLPEKTKWTQELVHEVASFTGVNDVHDDQVDVLSTIYDCLQTSKKPRWRVR